MNDSVGEILALRHLLRTQHWERSQGLSVGVADGVGGWEDVTNPALFTQALMYHCHRYSKQGWAGEPETDPTQCYEERETIEGWELTPARCLENAHTAVLREKGVVAGKSASTTRHPSRPGRNSTIGSSTATILNFNASSGLLRTLKCVCCAYSSRFELSLSSSLGDSGFIIVRSSNIIYESVYQTHYFNCPLYGLSNPPEPR